MQRVVLALVGLFIAADAQAYCRLTTAEPSAGGSCSTRGRGLEWHRQCISYTVVPRERGGLDLEHIRDTIDESFGQWTRVRCDDQLLPIALGQTERLGACTQAEYNQYGPNANTIMFLSEWEGEDFPREAFGLTLVWHDPQTGEIFDADMQLNETIAPIAICDESCGRDVVDLSNVVTHEAGHFLGLGHSNVHAATMSANALLGETAKRSLEADDEAGVCAIYGREPAPACDQSDYAPDRGFSALCGDEEDERSRGGIGSCAVGSPGGQASLSLSCLAALLLLHQRRRSRRR